jgi:hypothetical protein
MPRCVSNYTIIIQFLVLLFASDVISFSIGGKLSRQYTGSDNQIVSSSRYRYRHNSHEHAGVLLRSGLPIARATMRSDIREVRFQISPGLEVKAFEVTGWGWTGNENGYGLVIWPGARAVAKILSKQADLITAGCKVVELGAGSGLCSLVCAAMGAQVVATDLNLEPLTLAQEAAKKQGLKLKTQQFDILGSQPLPPCELLVIADCIYTPDLGRGVARRVLEVKNRGGAAVVGSSVNRPGYAVFREEMRRAGYGDLRTERAVDFSSPLWLLDAVRGNYVQEITIF